jgi:hypothetical protein
MYNIEALPVAFDFLNKALSEVEISSQDLQETNIYLVNLD